MIALLVVLSGTVGGPLKKSHAETPKIETLTINLTDYIDITDYQHDFPQDKASSHCEFWDDIDCWEYWDRHTEPTVTTVS